MQSPNFSDISSLLSCLSSLKIVSVPSFMETLRSHLLPLVRVQLPEHTSEAEYPWERPDSIAMGAEYPRERCDSIVMGTEYPQGRHDSIALVDVKVTLQKFQVVHPRAFEQ